MERKTKKLYLVTRFGYCHDGTCCEEFREYEKLLTEAEVELLNSLELLVEEI